MIKKKGIVTGYSHEGAGVFRDEDGVYFIPGTIEGEDIVFECPEGGNSKMPKRAQLISILEASPDRVEPRCPYVAECGGCQLQHVEYSRQLEIKKNILGRALRPLAKRGMSLSAPLPTGDSQPWGYRNKGIFAIQRQENEIKIGFYKAREQVVVSQGCPGLFSEEINSLIKKITQWLQNHDAVVDNEGLHHLMVRESKTTGEIILILIADQEKPNWLDEFVQDFSSAKQTKINGIGWLRAVNKQGPVLRGRPETLWGSLELVEKLGKINYTLSPLAFFQVNTQQAKALYDQIADLANLNGDDIVWDLYSGTGSIALYLAGSVKHVLGIETVGPAVVDANKNAIRNNIKNTRFIQTNAEDYLRQPIPKKDRPDVIILDPPTKGCEKVVIEAMRKILPKKIVYASCNPATLARDLDLLIREGIYSVQEIRSIDLFPHTSHVETVVLMSRVEK